QLLAPRAVRAIDPQHVSPQVGENHAAERSRGQARNLDHLDPGQGARPCFHAASLPRPTSPGPEGEANRDPTSRLITRNGRFCIRYVMICGGFSGDKADLGTWLA